MTAPKGPSPTQDWDPASVKQVLARFGGKWTIDLLAALWAGPRRPTELRALLPGIQERVMLSSLRALIDRGLVERHERPAVPVSTVEYALTAAALGMGELLTRLSVDGGERGGK